VTAVRTINGHLVAPMEPGLAATLFPSAKQAMMDGHNWVAIPHTLDGARVMRNMGLRAPSPIRTGYHWPRKPGYDPLPHQISTAEFLTLNQRGFVLNGMGTMKTLSTLWAADYLMSIGVITRALIVAPLSTLEQVWANEIFFNLPHRSYAVLHGSRAKRLKLLAKKADFSIINPGGLDIILKDMKARGDIDLLIIDEVAEFSNATTDKWKHLNTLVTPARWAWGLTGAPTPQAPTDAYAQVLLLKPENLQGVSFRSFKMRTMYQVSTFRWIPRDDAQQTVFSVMQPAIRYRKADCIKLPPTTYQDRHVDLTTEQRKHHEKLVKDSLTTAHGVNVTAVNAGVLLQKLVQTACGVVYGADGQQAILDASTRLSVVRELIDESEGKIILFIPFTGALDRVAQELGKKYTVAVVDGNVSKAKRDVIFHEFEHSPEPRVLIAHPGVMAHGLNLIAASTMLWYAPFASNRIYEQACERMARPGQTFNMTIVHISATETERRIYAGLKTKQSMQQVLLDMVEGGTVN